MLETPVPATLPSRVSVPPLRRTSRSPSDGSENTAPSGKRRFFGRQLAALLRRLCRQLGLAAVHGGQAGFPSPASAPRAGVSFSVSARSLASTSLCRLRGVRWRVTSQPPIADRDQRATADEQQWGFRFTGRRRLDGRRRAVFWAVVVADLLQARPRGFHGLLAGWRCPPLRAAT